MLPLIEQHKADLADLCRKYKVKSLEVFGSAANGAWDPTTSDLDFLVDFLPLSPGPHSKSYFGLWFALQELFQRDVDLVETPATIANPFFRLAVNRSRRVLYAA
jgi:predicted nucleotidyltransferase